MLWEDLFAENSSKAASGMNSNKIELNKYISDLIDEEIRRTRCRSLKKNLRDIRKDIVKFLTECFEEEKQKDNLADHVWDSIGLDPKLVSIRGILATMAGSLDLNRENITITRLSPEKEKKIENAIKRHASARKNEEEKDDPIPTSSKRSRCDPRPMNPVFVPPKSVFDNTNSNQVSTSPVIQAKSTSNDIPSSAKSSSSSKNRNVLYSTGSRTNRSSSSPRPQSSKVTSSSTKESEPKKSINVSVPPSAETNENYDLNYRHQRKSPPPPEPELESESEPEREREPEPEPQLEEEDSEEDDNYRYRFRPKPRNFDYYKKFSAAYRSTLFSQPQGNDSQNDTVEEDEEMEDQNSINDNNNSIEDFQNNEVEDDLDDNESANNSSYRMPPRDRYTQRSSTSTTPISNNRQKSGYFHQASVNREEEEETLPERRRTITFHDKVVDNEHTPRSENYSDQRTVTLGNGLQPHVTVDLDLKVLMEGPNPIKGGLLAFPNQRALCHQPAYQVLEKWIPTTSFEGNIEDTFDEFQSSRYIPGGDLFHSPKAPIHLFIFDSMLTSIPFKATYQRVASIDCGYPNKPSLINDHLETEIAAEKNDYVMKNVYICVGLDMIVLDPDLERALKNIWCFYEEHLNLLIAAFDPKGPKRYKRVYEYEDKDKKMKITESQLKLEFDKDCYIAIIPPAVTFITIPRVQPLDNDLDRRILKLNRLIHQFVRDKKELAASKKITLKLYDWSKASTKFDQCNLQHLNKRNGILMKHLTEVDKIYMKPVKEQRQS